MLALESGNDTTAAERRLDEIVSSRVVSMFSGF